MRQLKFLSLSMLWFWCNSFVLAQCPGSFTCEGVQVLCAPKDLNNFSCQTIDISNINFPLPNLCFGQGVPTNLSWWGFLTQDGSITVTLTTDLAGCEQDEGIQAGLFEGDCSGSNVADCNADCNSSVITLNTATSNGEIVYLYVDGCNGDVCSFDINIQGNVDAPSLSNFFLTVENLSPMCVGRQIPFQVQGGEERIWVKEWTIDGQSASINQTLLYTPEEEGQYEICATVGFRHEPSCAEKTICRTINLIIDQKIGALRRICTRSQPFIWHGNEITQSCVNPPCTARVVDIEDCIVDSIVPFLIQPIERRIGSLREVDTTGNYPFIWHGTPIYFSCIQPPCTARLQTADGCLFDSIRQIKLLNLPPGTGKIKGTVYNDIDNDCDFDTGEPLLEGIQLNIDGNNHNYQTLTDSLGYYELFVQEDQYRVTALDLTDSFSLCPIPHSADVEVEKIHCLDFFKLPTQCHPGRLKIMALTGRDRLRCDPRRRTLHLEASNTSKEPLPSEEIIITVDSLVDFQQSNLPYSRVSAKEIRITIPEIPPQSVIDFYIIYLGDCNFDNENDVACFEARYALDYQCNGSPLVSTSCETVRNSRDPNDITITPYGWGRSRYIHRSETLQGLIRYHNDGTDTAYDVKVRLDLPFEYLDLSTLQLLDGSAERIVLEVEEDHIIFDLPNVKLPHNAVDSINAHGYIRYSIRPDINAPDWASIPQFARIFFDFNDAIFTNIEQQIIAGPFIQQNEELIICQGDSVWGLEITKDTVLTDTLEFEKLLIENRLFVSVLPTYDFVIDTQILAGNEIRAQRIYRDTVISFEFLTKKGCDSIYTYNVDAQSTRIKSQDFDKVSIYPNPSSHGVLKINGAVIETGIMNIIDQNCRQFQLSINHNSIDIIGVPHGVYFYRLQLKNRALTGKLTIL